MSISALQDGSSPSFAASGSSEDHFSEELLRHIDMQQGFWLAMTKVIEANNEALSTSKMVLYSMQERDQLQTMLDNMKELALFVGARRQQDLLRLHRRLEQALAFYDNFFEVSMGSA